MFFSISPNAPTAFSSSVAVKNFPKKLLPPSGVFALASAIMSRFRNSRSKSGLSGIRQGHRRGPSPPHRISGRCRTPCGLLQSRSGRAGAMRRSPAAAPHPRRAHRAAHGEDPPCRPCRHDRRGSRRGTPARETSRPGMSAAAHFLRHTSSRSSSASKFSRGSGR